MTKVHEVNQQSYKPEGTIATMWQDTNYKTFTDDLARMTLFSSQRGRNLHYLSSPVSYHELGRKHIVDNFLGDWVLMLDTDHSFSPDILERMLLLQKKTNIPVLSAIYQFKAPPHSPVASVWTPDGKLVPVLDWDREKEVMEVGVVGAGCLLVQRWVFLEIISKLREDPFGIRPGLSEDYSFCKRCKELEIPIYLALQIECHHVVRSVLSVQDYRPNIKTQSFEIESGNIVK